jgi:hypothetical protein
MRAHLEAERAFVIEVVGEALGKIRKQLRKEISAEVGQLRAEISIAKRAHGDSQVIDLPSPLIRKRRDAA